MTFKVAFIGAGYMGEEHLKVFSVQPEFEMSGIFSKNKNKANLLANKYNVGFVADSIDDLFKNSRPELLVICVPELELWNVFATASLYPWKMLIEKPVGINLSQANEFLVKAKENNLCEADVISKFIIKRTAEAPILKREDMIKYCDDFINEFINTN